MEGWSVRVGRVWGLGFGVGVFRALVQAKLADVSAKGAEL